MAEVFAFTPDVDAKPLFHNCCQPFQQRHLSGLDLYLRRIQAKEFRTIDFWKGLHLT